MLSNHRIVSDQLPPWIDEGMALVADTASKRAAHECDLQTAIHAGRQFRMGELLRLQTYPSENRIGTFYGQSLSVVEFLSERGGRRKFVSFITQSTKHGYDLALRDVYRIQDVQELDRLWLASVRGPRQRMGRTAGLSRPLPENRPGRNSRELH